MKGVKRRKRENLEVPTEYNATMDHNVNKNFTKRIIRQPLKVTGQRKHVSVERCAQALLSTSAQQLTQHHPHKAVPFTKTVENVTMSKLESGNALNPSAKIKLQLFPINESTHSGLEKDGHNPYLELTLNARKKLSSVLKHLNSKWGNSSTALGELMLFPYNIGLGSPASCRRWTLNDSDISAGDVYAAIGSTAIFRLRYGWFSKLEPKTFEVPCPFTALEGFSQHEGADKGCGADMETTRGKKIRLSVAGEDSRQIDKSKAMGAVTSGQMSSDGQDDEMKMNNGVSLTSALWADNLTSISIGGLLSEVSLQAKSCRTNSVLHPVQLPPDSLDAFFAAQTKSLSHSQCQKQSYRAPPLSILDSEETCHAFTFKNVSSSSNNILALSRNTSGAGNQDANPGPFKIPNLTEANSHSGLAQYSYCQEFKPDMLPCSRVYNDDSSLGLTGIKWNDSLEPFDLGLSCQKINGDTVG